MRVLFGLIFILFLNVFAIASERNNIISLELTNDKIREFILNNPQIILESLKRYEEKINAATKSSEQEVIRNELLRLEENRNDFIGGNPTGPITLIEFVDYRCGYCRKAHKEVGELLNKNGEIKFIVKEFPILGEQSLLAAKAGIAIFKYQGNKIYEKFSKKIINYDGVITTQLISKIVEEAGGDTEDLQNKMESEHVYQVLNSNFQLAKKLKITGTPTFIIGTEIIRGYKSVNALQEIINREKQAL